MNFDGDSDSEDSEGQNVERGRSVSDYSTDDEDDESYESYDEDESPRNSYYREHAYSFEDSHGFTRGYSISRSYNSASNRDFNFNLIHFAGPLFNHFSQTFAFNHSAFNPSMFNRPTSDHPSFGHSQDEPEREVIIIDDDDDDDDDDKTDKPNNGRRASGNATSENVQSGDNNSSNSNDDGDVQIIECPSEAPSGDETLVCPICYGELQSPAALPCGHVFCFRCIRKKLDEQTFCPLCLAKTKPSKIIKLFI